MLKIPQVGASTVTGRICRFAKRAVERLARMNYYTARAHYHYELARADRRYKEPPLLVYQMAKVGSKTVTESLRTAKINRHLYHFHILRKGRVGEYERWRKKSFPHIDDGLKYVWRCQYIRKQVERGLSGKKWKIVTLVRDPIARNLSDFFQNIQVEPLGSGRQWKLKGVGSEVSEAYDFEITVNNNNAEELIGIFLARYRHNDPLMWFDLEFMGVLGIDIYASDFPTSKGYKIYEEKGADILLIRLENLDDCAAEAFNEFLNIDNLTLVNTNIGGQKDYADIYQVFKDSIVFPQAYLDRMYLSKFAQHFYSEAEIEQFRAHWSKKPGPEERVTISIFGAS